MIHIDASGLSYQQLNEKIRSCQGDVFLENCCGQRFLGTGMGEKHIRIQGTPGNALGAYLNGASIEVLGNAQDAVGDTMNAGRIVIHGSLGDTAGYAMRGGEIYVRGDAGYRTGVHMKAYGDKFPVIVVGGRTGSFLGEYQAGGILIVLGLKDSTEPIVRNFPCTGMHGGKLFIRSACENVLFPKQVAPRAATPQDMEEILPHLQTFARLFGEDYEEICNAPFTLVVPDSQNPYHQMYVSN